MTAPTYLARLREKASPRPWDRSATDTGLDEGSLERVFANCILERIAVNSFDALVAAIEAVGQYNLGYNSSKDECYCLFCGCHAAGEHGAMPSGAQCPQETIDALLAAIEEQAEKALTGAGALKEE